jgi:hypothetical protein
MRKDAENFIGQFIRCDVQPIGIERVSQFELATQGAVGVLPPLLPTIFREIECRWLDKMEVDWHGLLHAEQAYEFLRSIPIDKSLQMCTTVKSVKRRKSGGKNMAFVDLETVISREGIKLCVAHTHFVVRSTA